jgi:hypothetical protein
MPRGEKLGRRKEALIAALLTSATVRAAAQTANVNERTARNWLHEPSFRRAYRQARQDILERTTSLLLQLTGKAVLTLHGSLDARDEAVKLRASIAVLEYAKEMAGEQDLAEDVAELKEQVKELQHGQVSAHPGHPAASGNGRRT